MALIARNQGAEGTRSRCCSIRVWTRHLAAVAALKENLSGPPARLAEQVYDEVRPLGGVGGWTYVRDGAASIIDPSTGFKSALFEKGGEYVLAFAGTDGPDFNDIVNNVGQGVIGVSAQYIQAIDVAAYVVKKHGPNVRFVGHSLGGGLATAAAVVHNKPATTFNAAGLNSRTVAGYSLDSADSLVDAWRVRGEPLTAVQDYGLLGVANSVLAKIPVVGGLFTFLNKTSTEPECQAAALAKEWCMSR